MPGPHATRSGVTWFFHRGHPVVHDDYAADDSIRYEDGTPWDDEERPCGACDLVADDRHAPDPCLGMLPGVRAACCGHGREGLAYVFMDDRTVREGHAALGVLEYLGGVPAPLTLPHVRSILDELAARSHVWMAQARVAHGTVAAAAGQAAESLRRMRP